MNINITDTELALYAHYRQSVAPDLAFMQVARVAGIDFDQFLQMLVRQQEDEPVLEVEQIEEVVEQPEEAIIESDQ